MTFVVTDNCIKCKYTDCVEVCPVDCFYEGPNFLVIHPDECIDCALCEPECPAAAIYAEDEGMPIRKSHQNPEVIKIYEDFLGKPLGAKSHHLLHTQYSPRNRF